MNWQAIKYLTPVRIGAFLALLIVVFLPNYGIRKYGPSPVVPGFLLFALGAWLVWKERGVLFSATAMRRWLLVFLLLFVPVLISVPASLNPRMSMSIAGVLFLYFFAGVALVRALRGDSERRWVAKWIAVVLAVWVVDGYIQYLFGKDLFLVALGGENRVIGPFEDNLHMPVLLAFLLPILLWVVLRWSGAIGTIGAIGAYLASAVVIMLCGARTVLVLLGILAAGLYVRLPRWRWKLPLFLVVASLLAVGVGLSPTLKDRIARLSVLQTISFETIDEALSQRLTIWDTASHMLIDRPFTGVGAGAFAQAYDRYSTRPNDMFRGGTASAFHAHQLYVGIAAETGLPGLIGLVVIFVLCVKWYFGAPPARRDQAWPFALGLLTYAFPFNTQSVLFTQWLFPVIVMLLGGMLAALDEPAAGATPAEQI